MFISKTDYLLFKQCPKSFWLHKHNLNIVNQRNKSRLEKGNEITEIARELFPNGFLVPFSINKKKMLEQTNELLAQGATTIYEAAFEWDGLFVICDILHLDEDGWKVFEVKSSTGISERHLDDISFQFYVIKQNLAIHSISAVYLNNQYSRRGVLEIQKLFTVSDKTNELAERLSSIPSEVIKMKHLVDEAEPSMDIGSYCNKYGKDAFPCHAKEYCWCHIPQHSVFDITNIGKKAFNLYYEGIISIRDIPNNYKLSESQAFQVTALKENRSIINKEQIQEFLKTFKYPFYFLDFETYQQPVPLYDGISPYNQVPFQYSLHIKKSLNEDLEHREYLAIEGTDPRREMAERLVHDIPLGVCTVAYNMSFEKMILKQLAYQFPDLAVHLMDIHKNMVDLMIPFQKKWYYTNNMKGSYSIKYVLPSLLPNDESLNYQNLNIQNGGMAMEIYERLHTYPEEDIEGIRQDLLDYCKLDTLAMVRIWEHLNDIA
jgi:hypothetical protein